MVYSVLFSVRSLGEMCARPRFGSDKTVSMRGNILVNLHLALLIAAQGWRILHASSEPNAHSLWNPVRNFQ